MNRHSSIYYPSKVRAAAVRALIEDRHAQDRARHEGFAAFEGGAPHEANPYDEFSDLGEAWEAGYLQGLARALVLMRNSLRRRGYPVSPRIP